MKYFQIEVLGEENDDYCFSNNSPSKIGDYKLMVGKSLKKEYPSDPFEITLELDEDAPGLVCASFLGNTKSFLMMKQEAADVILKHNIKKIEVYSFTLLDHEKKIHSKEYVFVNPLGTFDCLNMELSDYDRATSGKILGFNEFVLDKNKMKIAPDLFRPQEDDSAYFFSEKLVNALAEEGFTNFEFEELQTGR